MTRREKYLQEHPNAKVNGNGNPLGCPSEYLDDGECGKHYTCKECWDQEVPGTNTTNEPRKETEEMAEKVLMSTEDMFNANRNQIDYLMAENKMLEQQVQTERAARQVRMIFDAYVGAGFTEEQAWELVKMLTKGAIENSIK